MDAGECMAVQQDQIFQMHQVRFEPLARAGFMEKHALHPCRAKAREPRPFVEAAGRQLGSPEGLQRVFRPKGFEFIKDRIHATGALSCQQKITHWFTYSRVFQTGGRFNAGRTTRANRSGHAPRTP
jgi:hypothetical protein